MKEIENNKKGLEKKPVNALIKGTQIVPGVNGLLVNKNDSYYQMKKINKYVSSKIVFDEVKPDISIDNNKNLIISHGRLDKQNIALLIINNKAILDYFVGQKIKFTRLVTYELFKSNAPYEQVNIDSNYHDLDVLLNKYKLNKNICIVSYSDKKICEKSNKYLVMPSYRVSKYIEIKNKIIAGDIILLDDSFSFSDVKLLLKEINYRNLKLVTLSEIISEKR